MKNNRSEEKMTMRDYDRRLNDRCVCCNEFLNEGGRDVMCDKCRRACYESDNNYNDWCVDSVLGWNEDISLSDLKIDTCY